MLATIVQKNGKNGVQISEKFYSFQGQKQDRLYINYNGKTVSLDKNLLTFEEGSIVELDNYKKTRQNKTTTEHGGQKQQRKNKSSYNIFDYLTTEQGEQVKQIEKQSDNAKQILNECEQKYRAFVYIASKNYNAEQGKNKAKLIAEQKQKAKAVHDKKLALLEKLAKELGVTIA